MRCLYCYNPEIVLGKGTISFDEVVSFLKSRVGLINAVVLSGGECLLHKSILEHIRVIKSLGFLIKIDTNGSKPLLLQNLINEHLIDYVALDFKAPRHKFDPITQSKLFDEFEKSLDVLLKSNVIFEVRTTYHSVLLSENDLTDMAKWLKEKGYQGNYYVQNFRNNVKSLGNLPNSLNFKKRENLLVELPLIIRD